MSTKLFESSSLCVTSYCGPAKTDEHTRMRLQIGTLGGDIGQLTLGYSDALSLASVLTAWIEEHKP